MHTGFVGTSDSDAANRDSTAPPTRGALAPLTATPIATAARDAPVTMTRLWPQTGLAPLVRHYWIPRWRLPAGQTVRQGVLEYPATNLVIEAQTARLYGAHRGRSERELEASGWAFGALLQPGTGRRLLGSSVRAIVGGDIDIESLAVPGGAELVQAVRAAAMHPDSGVRGTGTATADPRDVAMVAAFETWFSELELPPDADAALVDDIVAAVESDRELLRVERLAQRFDLGMRRLQRLVGEYVGFSPKWLIQRARLQEAAQSLAESDAPTIASLAASLGYADQAHFSREFKRVIGMPPGEYRAGAR